MNSVIYELWFMGRNKSELKTRKWKVTGNSWHIKMLNVSGIVLAQSLLSCTWIMMINTTIIINFVCARSCELEQNEGRRLHKHACPWYLDIKRHVLFHCLHHTRVKGTQVYNFKRLALLAFVALRYSKRKGGLLINVLLLGRWGALAWKEHTK